MPEPNESNDPDDRETEFDRVVHEYYQAIERGENVDQQAFIKDHIEFADELHSFFSDLDQFGNAVGLHQTKSREEIEPTSGLGSGDALVELGTTIRYIGEYRILSEVARGGMGVVFKARQEKLRRTVALKMILSGRFANDIQIERFYREARAAAALKHPNIISVYEIGNHLGHHYFSMDFIDGESLSQRLRDGSMPPRRAARLVEVLARATHYAHQQGVLHRDLKPGNVLMDSQGVPHISDFGLAKPIIDSEGDTVDEITHSGQILGTPSYMAPEQAAAKHQLVSVASDVYSLGAILYACLTGRAPFVAESTIETLRQVIEQDPFPLRTLNPRIPKDLETICHKCLAKEAHRRYATAEELADDLRRYSRGQPVLARPISPISRTVRWTKRKPWVAATTALLLLLALAGPIVAVRQLALQRVASEHALQATKDAAAAKASRDLAEQNLQLAKENAEAERMAKEETRAGLARSKYFLAKAYWNADRVREARMTLESIPDEFRKIEWNLAQQEFVGSHATLIGHDTVIHSVAISGDGRYVASGGESNIRIWDAPSGKELRSFEVSGFVRCLSFSRDGTKLYSCSENTLDVWAVPSGEKIATLYELDAGDQLRTFALSRDEKQVVIGTRARGTRHQIRWWDLSDSESQQVVNVGDGGIRHVAFNPDGSSIVSVGFGSVLRVWDVKTKKQSWHSYDITDAVFSPDGRNLASIKNFLGWQVHDAATGDSLQKGQSTDKGIRQASCIAISPAGTRIAVGTFDGLISMIDLKSGSTRTYRGHEDVIRDLVFSSDGALLVSASFDQTVRIWRNNESDVHDRRAALIADSVIDKHPERISIDALTRHFFNYVDVAFHPDGTRIATGSFSRNVFIWDTETSKLVQTLQGHSDLITCVAFSPDGEKLASACIDKTIRIWNLADGVVAEELVGHRDLITDLQFSPDSRSLASSDLDATVKVWDFADGQERHTWRQHRGSVYGVAFSPDGKKLVSTGFDGAIHCWDLGTGTLSRIQTGTGAIRCFEFEKGSSSLVWIGTGTSSPGQLRNLRSRDPGTVQLWDLSSGKRVRSLATGEAPINSLSLNLRRDRLVTCDDGGFVKLWDLETGEELWARDNWRQSGVVLFAPLRSVFAVAKPYSNSMRGPIPYPLEELRIDVYDGAPESNQFAGGLQSRDQAVWHRKLAFAYQTQNPYAAAAHLGWWLQQTPASNPYFDLGVRYLRRSVDQWKESFETNGSLQPSGNVEDLLPSAVHEILAAHPEAAQESTESNDAPVNDEGLPTIERWENVQQSLRKADELETKGEHAEASQVYRNLLAEIEDDTSDPFETVAHVFVKFPFRVTPAYVWNRLAASEKRAGNAAAYTATLEKFAETMKRNLRQDSSDDWQRYADTCFEIQNWTESGDAYERALVLGGNAELIPKKGEFSLWTSATDFRMLNRMMRSRQFKPSEIEGRQSGTTTEFRATFEPNENRNYYYYWGISEQVYQQRKRELGKKQYTEVMHDVFEDHLGNAVHSAIWEKQ